jgi:hypothetical protein
MANTSISRFNKIIYSKGRDIIMSVTACFDEEVRNKCLIVNLNKENNRAAGYMSVNST